MQFVLSPIYVLGALATGAAPRAAWLLPFLAVHVALYGGATAFNSYHDRDDGPIAFRKRPHEVGRGSMYVAVILQLAGVAVLVACDPVAGAIATVMFLMGIAYSHPRWRWKRSAVLSLAAVAVGQGAGAFALGYTVTAAGHAGTAADEGGGWRFMVLLAATAVTTAGLYPVTQVYQVDEDRRRGDDTLPARIGWRRSLAVSALLVAAGTWMMAAALAPVIARGWRNALLAAPVAQAMVLALWAARFEAQDAGRRHDWAMGIAGLASAFFLAFAWFGLGPGR